jgi:hypothetical protein
VVVARCAACAEREIVYGAFIVFNHEESFRRCVEDYQHSTSVLGRLFQPPALRLNGHRLKVEPAMEPSTILWENLDCTDLGRLGRRMLTFLVSIMLLLFSFALLYYTQQSRMVRYHTSLFC